jgi:hypothetical protein
MAKAIRRVRSAENFIKAKNLIEQYALFGVLYRTDFVMGVVFQKQIVTILDRLVQKTGFFIQR